MSNTTQSFGDLVKRIYLPAIIGFLGIVACGTCLSTGPFIPVGLSGLVILVVVIYFLVKHFKNVNRVEFLKDALNAETCKSKAADLNYKNEVNKTTVIVDKYKLLVNNLEKEVAELTAEKEALLKAIDKKVEKAEGPEEPETKKASKKSSKKS